MKRKEKLSRALLAPINPAAVIILGIYTLVWGVWVASPFWSVFGRAKLYAVLGSVAPEVFWGLLACTVGVMVIYGAWKRSPKSLIRGASLGGWHWLMISIFYFMGDVFSTGGITSLTFAIYAAFIYLNIKVNYDTRGECLKDTNRYDINDKICIEKTVMIIYSHGRNEEE